MMWVFNSKIQFNSHHFDVYALINFFLMKFQIFFIFSVMIIVFFVNTCFRIDCQAHRDSIIYLVTIWRRSEKWERKKELWELINLRRLISLINSSWYWSFDWMIDTRSWHYLSLSFLIRQDSFDVSCLSDETILTSSFDINIAFHFFFHFVRNIFNHILCFLYILSNSAERFDEMRH
jgi:hypothetical protein